MVDWVILEVLDFLHQIDNTIRFNKEKGPHPLFLSLKLKWKSSYDVCDSSKHW
jgi:hypothetical protein